MATKKVKVVLMNSIGGGFTVRSVTNSIEWVPGTHLDKKQVEAIIRRPNHEVTAKVFG